MEVGREGSLAYPIGAEKGDCPLGDAVKVTGTLHGEKQLPLRTSFGSTARKMHKIQTILQISEGGRYI